MVISVDEAVLARLSSQGERFEILVDPKEALKLRRGEKVKELLAVPQVFSDHRKGLRQSKENLQQVFGTTDVNQVARKIILKGELHLTAEQRKKILAAKKKQIIDSISRRAVDPHTGYPHPPKRIENALKEAKVKVDPFKPVEDQISGIIDKLRPILPMSLEKATLALSIPPTYAAKIYGTLERFGKIRGKNWRDDGSLAVKLVIPLALRGKVDEELNKLTRGSVKIREENG